LPDRTVGDNLRGARPPHGGRALRFPAAMPSDLGNIWHLGGSRSSQRRRPQEISISRALIVHSPARRCARLSSSHTAFDLQCWISILPALPASAWIGGAFSMSAACCGACRNLHRLPERLQGERVPHSLRCVRDLVSARSTRPVSARCRRVGWKPDVGAGRRINVQRQRIWCHWLLSGDFDFVAEPTDFDIAQ
jgi:hypothetical protein